MDGLDIFHPVGFFSLRQIQSCFLCILHSSSINRQCTFWLYSNLIFDVISRNSNLENQGSNVNQKDVVQGQRLVRENTSMYKKTVNELSGLHYKLGVWTWYNCRVIVIYIWKRPRDMSTFLRMCIYKSSVHPYQITLVIHQWPHLFFTCILFAFGYYWSSSVVSGRG